VGPELDVAGDISGSFSFPGGLKEAGDSDLVRPFLSYAIIVAWVLDIPISIYANREMAQQTWTDDVVLTQAIEPIQVGCPPIAGRNSLNSRDVR
jgi:hypothetical protein